MKLSHRKNQLLLILAALVLMFAAAALAQGPGDGSGRGNGRGGGFGPEHRLEMLTPGGNFNLMLSRFFQRGQLKIHRCFQAVVQPFVGPDPGSPGSASSVRHHA